MAHSEPRVRAVENSGGHSRLATQKNPQGRKKSGDLNAASSAAKLTEIGLQPPLFWCDKLHNNAAKRFSKTKTSGQTSSSAEEQLFRKDNSSGRLTSQKNQLNHLVLHRLALGNLIGQLRCPAYLS